MLQPLTASASKTVKLVPECNSVYQRMRSIPHQTTLKLLGRCNSSSSSSAVQSPKLCITHQMALLRKTGCLFIKRNCLQNHRCVSFRHSIAHPAVASKTGQYGQSSNLNQQHIIRFISISTSYRSSLTTLPGNIDRYQGVWVDLTKESEHGCAVEKLSEKEFENLFRASLESWKSQELTCVWLKLSMDLGKFLPVASRHGFTIHHAEGDNLTLALWMDKTHSKIPRFATHQMGVSGLVINEDTRDVLVVQDKNRPYTLWKFPGGLSDLGEDIAETTWKVAQPLLTQLLKPLTKCTIQIATTAEREVFEETGVKTEFQSVLAFRQQHNHPGAFGRSDLYVLCRLKPLTFDLHPCEEEIAACQWMSIDKLKEEVHASSLTHILADLALLGLRDGFDHIDIISYEMASIYKGMKFHIFHRPLK